MKNRFQTLRATADSFGEYNDCTVIAVAVATGCSYEKSWKALHDAGRLTRKGCSMVTVMSAVRSLGYDYKSVDCPAKTMVTLGRKLPSKGRFLAFTRNHVAGIAGGLIHDWTEGRQHRVLEYFQVTKA